MTQVIEADEAGRLVLPPELIGAVQPHARYTVETIGTKTIVEPVAASDEKELFTQAKLTPEEWMRQWNELSESISKVWNTDKSAAEIISEMRDARG